MAALSCSAVTSLQVLVGILSAFFEAQTPADLSSPATLRDGERFDFIIAGGGSAGCALANRSVQKAVLPLLKLMDFQQVQHFNIHNLSIKSRKSGFCVFSSVQSTAPAKLSQQNCVRISQF
jgi:hypothetical protein